MQSKESLDKPMFSDEEIKKLAESTTFTEEQLRKFFEACQSQYTKEELRNLVEGAYIPRQEQPIYVDQEHDVIYFLAEKDEIKKPDNSLKQFGSSTSQIYSRLHNPTETLDAFPDMETGSSHKGSEPTDRPMQPLKRGTPHGYKEMTIWSPELEKFCIATVPEDTPELTSEDIEKHRYHSRSV